MPALNGRALEVQVPACAGIRFDCSLPAKAGICFTKARGFSPVFLFLLTFPLHAQTIPHFRTAADARAWGEAREQSRQFEAAAEAYEQEAVIRRRTGDPQAAEIEHRRAERLRTELVLAITAPVPVKPAKLAKLEPAAGCYLGALDDYADGDDADHFGRRIGRPLAVCFDYSPYGAPFPMAWARRQAEAGRAIQIAWEPSDIGAVQDDEYLNQWAKDAGSCETPVFLRFGGEMNGNWTSWGRNPAAYRRAFRLVHEVVNRWASNVALVWAPGAVPTYNLDNYYPGDDVVDWVGISLYLVRYNDDSLSRPAWQDGPASFIEPFYAKYAARKPLCLTECGISRRSRVEGRDADDFASARIFDLLDAIKVRFPRLKMFCWFNRNNLETAGAGRRLNDYSLPDGSPALAAFHDAVSDPYFLSHFGDLPQYLYQVVENHLPTGYVGSLSAAISSYSLAPTLEIAAGGKTRRSGHPFSLFVSPGLGPLTVRVRDERGIIAKSVVVR
ncbi:MAG: glycoside hydrolase family 26 protein [Janthinobacterium lividum]